MTNGTPKLLEVAQVTIHPRAMSPEEIKDAAEKCDKSIDVIKALLDIGKAGIGFLKDKKTQELWTGRLEMVSGVGTILKGVLKFIPGPPNPMVEELQNLANAVEELEKKISNNFDEMKMHISEVNFFVKLMCPTVVLTRYMMDCMKDPGQRALQNFKKTYEKHSPIQLAYNLRSYLEQKSTNPLKMAMDAEKIKTVATFSKWEDIISRVLGQFLVLEAFGSGLLGIKGSFNWDRLYDSTHHIVDSMEKWKQEYKEDKSCNELYWEEMKSFLEPWLDKNAKLSNAEKADFIKNKLDNYLTADAFYVAVYDHYRGESHYWADIKAGGYQFINCFGPGGGNTFVYRSRFANDSSQNSFDTFRKNVQAFKDKNYQMPAALRNKGIANAGFIVLIGGLNEEIRHSNCPKGEAGPGWWTYTVDFGGPVHRRIFAGML
ncbi:hypothetical protein CAEBREN_05088 [Caenorhabditis brenneri]|uniref:Uncharacterized protein n=1 Tax=Caenorhabditis brenneri TaxID=135651 RepID=G0P048_CAEBE|nr:hypothetical protein CAEBREN_05088 [Caenorhabditis brenneri]